MSSKFRALFIILIVIHFECDIECKKPNYNLLKSFEIDENLLQKRREIICYRKSPEKCALNNRLNISKLSKPGICPNNSKIQSEQISLEICQEYDYECPGIKKCCPNNAGGWSCLDANNLNSDPYLPPIPFNVTIYERRKNGKMCEISWQINLNGTRKFPMLFVVEFRSFIGKIFTPHKFGNWQWHNFQKIAEMRSNEENTKKTIANIKLKIGRWYQFRVGAVNEHGFRGYSNISHEFRLSDDNYITSSKIRRSPRNFDITAIRILTNGSLYTKATWIPAKTDLPIEKYRISWSLHLKAEDHSLLHNEAYVKEPTRYYEFWDLSLNSIYYIQVQTIFINGNRRIKSPKENLMLNTTFPIRLISSNRETVLKISSPDIEAKNNSIINSQQGEIIIRFIANKKLGMIVRILCNELNKGSLLELCKGANGCETKEYNAIKTKKNHIDFNNLLFNTQYTVRLSVINNFDNTTATQKTFTTPACENWIRKFPNVNIICPKLKI